LAPAQILASDSDLRKGRKKKEGSEKFSCFIHRSNVQKKQLLAAAAAAAVGRLSSERLYIRSERTNERSIGVTQTVFCCYLASWQEVGRNSPNS
jgi:hypothetical protein